MTKAPAKGLASTVKVTISPDASPTGTKVMQILVSAPRPRKRDKPPVDPAKIPPPPSVEKGETVKPRKGLPLAQVCAKSVAPRYTAGRSAEIANMRDGSSVACYEIGAIILRDKARVAEARARGLDPRGFVPSWDAPRKSDASEDSSKLSFASAVNAAEMDAHNARVQPTVDRINAHNALVAVKYGTGIQYPCHNNGRKVRRKCRTYGVCAARRPKHHVCQLGRTPEVYEGPSDGAAFCRVPHGYAHGTVLRKLCQIAPARPLWALTGNLAERKARAKFQKRVAKEFVSGK